MLFDTTAKRHFMRTKRPPHTHTLVVVYSYLGNSPQGRVCMNCMNICALMSLVLAPHTLINVRGCAEARVSYCCQHSLSVTWLRSSEGLQLQTCPLLQHWSVGANCICALDFRFLINLSENAHKVPIFVMHESLFLMRPLLDLYWPLHRITCWGKHTTACCVISAAALFFLL